MARRSRCTERPSRSARRARRPWRSISRTWTFRTTSRMRRPRSRGSSTSGRLDAKIRVVFTQPLTGQSRSRPFGHGRSAELRREERRPAAARLGAIRGRRRLLRRFRTQDPDQQPEGGRHPRSGFGARRRASTGSRRPSSPRPPGAGRRPGAQAPKGSAAGPSLLVEIADIGIARGKIHYDDTAFARPFHALFEDVEVSVKGLLDGSGHGGLTRGVSEGPTPARR